MGFLKKLGKGIKKVGKKVGKAVVKVGKVAVKVAADRALGAAAGVIGQKAAAYGAGVVNRVASAPARRKAKKEKEARISKALAADIARPSIQMAASRDPDGARAMPGGNRIGGKTSSKPKNRMTVLPGGAPLNAPKTSKVTDKGVTDFFKETMRAQKASNKVRAAAMRKQLAAEKKAARAAASAAKKAAAAAARAEKATARKKAKEGTFVGSAIAGALGVKVGGKGTQAAKITAAAKRKTQSLVRSAVRKSPGASKAIPAIAGTTAILAAGGKALDANARRQVAKREKKLGRKLTPAEVKSVTTPRNPFLGK